MRTILNLPTIKKLFFLSKTKFWYKMSEVLEYS